MASFVVSGINISIFGKAWMESFAIGYIYVKDPYKTQDTAVRNVP
jgi:hypothetical protein